ncbi:MAG: hypothetical protein MK214_02880 [Thalassotalea sp.]|nr:hypothetical protein [Thalassotalea sp.]
MGIYTANEQALPVHGHEAKQQSVSQQSSSALTSSGVEVSIVSFEAVTCFTES